MKQARAGQRPHGSRWLVIVSFLVVTLSATFMAFSLFSANAGAALPEPVARAAQRVVPPTPLDALSVAPAERGAPMPVELREPPVIAELDPERPCPGSICGVVEQRGVGVLPGARCSLYPGEAPSGLAMAFDARDPAACAVASVVSDANGAFELPAATGYWTLLVEADGLASWREDSLPSGASRHVLLERQETLVLFVIDEQGAPVADAECRLLVDFYHSRSKARFGTRSDSDGRAEIPLQAGESWFIEVVHPSYLQYGFRAPAPGGAMVIEMTVALKQGLRLVGTVRDTQGRVPAKSQVLVDLLGRRESPLLSCDAEGRFDSGPIFRSGTELHLTGRAPGYGEGLRLLRLDAAGVTDGAAHVELILAPLGVTIVGQVVTRDEEQPGPVDLFLQPFTEGSFYSARKLLPRSLSWRPMASTDELGQFVISGLKGQQQYRILAVPRRDFTPVQVRFPGAPAGSTHDLGQLPLTASGRVFGFVHHEDGTAVPHLMVSALPVTTHSGSQDADPHYFPSQFAGRLDTFTNQQGRFDLMMFDASGEISYELYWGEDWTVNGSHLRDSLSFAPGQVVGPIELIVPDIESDDGSLSGTATDVLGDPVESLLVESWDGPANERSIGQGLLGSALTGADGRFSLDHQPTGRELRITATDPRGRFETLTVHSTIPRSGTTLDLGLRPAAVPPAVLEGTVEDGDGQPLADVDLRLFFNPMVVRCSSCMNFSARTDEQGRFSFGFVVEGQHVVRAVDSLSFHRSASVDVQPGVPAVLVLDP